MQFSDHIIRYFSGRRLKTQNGVVFNVTEAEVNPNSVCLNLAIQILFDNGNKVAEDDVHYHVKQMLKTYFNSQMGVSTAFTNGKQIKIHSFPERK